jgi:hypothetical protein
MTLSVRVIPRSPKSAIVGRRGDAILIRLAAPPVEGAANEALVSLLSKVFDRPRGSISIVSGQKSRDKRVAIAGLTETELATCLSDILKPDAK